MAMFHNIFGLIQYQLWVCTYPLLLPVDSSDNSLPTQRNDNVNGTLGIVCVAFPYKQTHTTSNAGTDTDANAGLGPGVIPGLAFALTSERCVSVWNCICGIFTPPGKNNARRRHWRQCWNGSRRLSGIVVGVSRNNGVFGTHEGHPPEPITWLPYFPLDPTWEPPETYLCAFLRCSMTWHRDTENVASALCVDVEVHTQDRLSTKCNLQRKLKPNVTWMDQPMTDRGVANSPLLIGFHNLVTLGLSLRCKTVHNTQCQHWRPMPGWVRVPLWHQHKCRIAVCMLQN